MMQQITMNIHKGSTSLQYLIGVSNGVNTTHGTYGYKVMGECNDLIHFFNETPGIQNVVQNTNIWIPDDSEYQNTEVPQTVNQKHVRLYIPDYSIDSFRPDDIVETDNISVLRYVVTAYTFIHGCKIVLGSYLFSIDDTVAAPSIFRYKGQDYRSMIEFNIIDPQPMVYDDVWAGFRQGLCGEPSGLNNAGSVLCFDLYVVTPTNSGYIESTEYKGCTNGIQFNRYTNDIMKANLELDTNATLTLLFNEVYNNNILEYVRETYNMQDGCTLAYELVVKDRENIYAALPVQVNHIGSDWINPDPYNGPVHKVFTRYDFQEIGMDNWVWYKDGLFLQGCIYIFPPTDENLNFEEMFEYNFPITECISNEIPLTREKYKYMLPLENPWGFEKLKLTDIAMQQYNLHVVNKIQKNIISVNRPEDAKANIIKPVFVRSVDQKNIVVHPEVVESLSFNLNRYKSMVDIFNIRIEGTDFMEIGRTDNAVVFRIDGNLLPNEITEGKYYILNENHEVITSGNYKYE